jgi:hypothetical protein
MNGQTSKIGGGQYHVHLAATQGPAGLRGHSRSQRGRVDDRRRHFQQQIDIATAALVIQTRTEQPQTRMRPAYFDRQAFPRWICSVLNRMLKPGIAATAGVTRGDPLRVLPGLAK